MFTGETLGNIHTIHLPAELKHVLGDYSQVHDTDVNIINYFNSEP